MSDCLQPNTVLDANELLLIQAPVPAEDVVAGSPHTGTLALVTADDLEIGVWEISPGAVTDTEENETFVVLSGSGTVELLDTGTVLNLGAGTIGRFAAGTRTKWTITETLRKIYVTAS